MDEVCVEGLEGGKNGIDNLGKNPSGWVAGWKKKRECAIEKRGLEWDWRLKLATCDVVAWIALAVPACPAAVPTKRNGTFFHTTDRKVP